MGTYAKLLRNPHVRNVFLRRCATKAQKEGSTKPIKEGTTKPIKEGASKPVKLPRLPVPLLEQTLTRFLRSARPFVECDEYCRLESMVKSFGAPGGQGECLQEMLEKKGGTDDPNWLYEIWLNNAYLGYRNPVVIHSSPGQIFPKQVFNTEDEYAMCAAKMLVGALSFKKMADERKIPLESIAGALLCMDQYYKVFGTNRTPSKPLDELKLNPDSDHVIVMHNNHFFKLKVKNGDKIISISDAFYNIKEIIKNSSCLTVPIGILTTEQRDEWADAYNDLIKDGVSCSSVEAVEKSLLILCLDRICPTPCVNNMTTTAGQMIHGGGPGVNSGNRWFDKTIQLIVGRDGGIGITLEHTPAEGGIATALQDHIIPLLGKNVPAGEGGSPMFEELAFNISDNVKSAISKAQCNSNELINSLELCCFSFDEFGKDELKKLKVSPDGFIQLAIQLAFYRIHQVPGAQYESGTLRLYKSGRTEAIRSCQEETMVFVRAMGDGDLSPSSKARALKTALRAHKEYTVAAMSMKGIDRHFLALKVLSDENSMPLHDLFSSPGYVKSSHFRLSTSQVASKENGFMAYGPLTEDGYGCCYNPRDSNINFGVSSFTSCGETCAFNFKDNLEQSLIDMKEVLASETTAKL